MAKKPQAYVLRVGSEWVDLPWWARWIAKDADGTWFFYRLKPTTWDPIWWPNRSDQKMEMAGRTKPTPGWRNELYRIVRPL